MLSMQARYQQSDPQPTHDDIIHFSEVSWDDYERLLVMRGDHSAPRIAYLEGEVEIMSPSQTHESIKSMIGRLVETYCLERDIVFSTYGSWTLKDKARNRGAEPDECYVFGTAPAERPHLAIEVVWTHGRIDKLEIYRQLGVAEVWYWRQGLIQPYCLRGERYEPVSESQVLPGLDLPLLMRFIDEPTTSQAIRGYRDALRGDERG
ncbi:Uma2 family endonuclease [Thiocapsa roseopersicina]|uniref:Endonuclease, Uma2 family (Restriction endonuclease fold) n=1 Tax=Thiocapsa roseopersicina TaxID=1058 RepID=A0A1H3BNI9_THIRO|nr:Uma2 family endonuclease [Thiocapsa roseopersicina]SDX43463.1 Endonuclease, Uma2 family (restriction endonuclease fold) [Thiocapsa roseopersicina]